MRREVISGLFFILLGSIFILNSLVILAGISPKVFLEFWPLFLIIIGLNFIFETKVNLIRQSMP